MHRGNDDELLGQLGLRRDLLVNLAWVSVAGSQVHGKGDHLRMMVGNALSSSLRSDPIRPFDSLFDSSPWVNRPLGGFISCQYKQLGLTN